MQRIPVYEADLGGNVSAYVEECIASGWISSRGPFIDKFERAFADYVGAEAAVSVANGTVAIHLVLAALGIGAGDEVIVPSLTYIASVNPILQVGAKPILVDSLMDTLQVDPQAIRRAISPRTKAVMVVHLYGHACDMDAICSLCREHGLLLVEDCAEAVGTRWRGRHVGTFGDVATFSFFGNKTITTGEGGMVLAADRRVLARCRYLKGQAVSSTREYWHEELGYNYRMTNIEAAIGLAQLEMADGFLEKKRALAARYRAALAGLPLRIHEAAEHVTHSYWMCSIILHEKTDRDALRAHLKAKDVDTRPFFVPVHLMPHVRDTGSFPVAIELGQRGINLPSYPSLTEEQVNHVTSAVRGYFAER